MLIREFTGEDFIDGEKPGIYWLVLNPAITAKVAIFAPIVAVILSLLIPGSLRAKYDEQLLIAFVLTGLLLVVLTLLGPTIGRLHHIQTLRYGGHTYYLADRVPMDSVRLLRGACMHPDARPDCKASRTRSSWRSTRARAS